ncbi:hypothetical protein E4U33_001583, partial [Claviceps sp. LM78 group G4]
MILGTLNTRVAAYVVEGIRIAGAAGSLVFITLAYCRHIAYDIEGVRNFALPTDHIHTCLWRTFHMGPRVIEDSRHGIISEPAGSGGESLGELRVV